MEKIVSPKAEWPALMRQLQAAMPEAFDSAGRVLNLIEGEWRNPGQPRKVISSLDGSCLGNLPMADHDSALRAVRFAKKESYDWGKTDLDNRRAMLSECFAHLRKHRDLIALLLMWEIGKTFATASNDIDRCISGAEWYVENIASMLEGRKPIGLVSNIAAWNYPMSVLMHTVLVQVLAGNSAIAKTPTDGGLFALTLAMGLARRAGLPVSLISGSGEQLSDALVRSQDVDCLSFVGGKTVGREVAKQLARANKRYMLEMEGVNPYGIYKFSDWPKLAEQLRKGFDYGKQRCTAYVRYVVQRELFPRFLDTWLSVVASLRFGNPVLVDKPEDSLPALDFGPLINAGKAEELHGQYREALSKGAVSLYQGELNPEMFMPGQDVSAYFAPATLYGVPKNAALYHAEPFGPVDTIVVVDKLEELIHEMNVSNGCLVASVATDDLALAKRIVPEIRAFKVGINVMRSRGDREELFGGIGQSWSGCFVGGKCLVQAVTVGPPGERLYGVGNHVNLPSVQLAIAPS